MTEPSPRPDRSDPDTPIDVVLTPAGFELLTAARGALLDAVLAERAPDRYEHAHRSAVRAAAAVLASRGRADPRRRRPVSVWVMIEHLAPELGEWAPVFGASSARCTGAGPDPLEAVTPREADDLLRDAEAFHARVRINLGLPGPVPLVLTQAALDALGVPAAHRSAG